MGASFFASVATVDDDDVVQVVDGAESFSCRSTDASALIDDLGQVEGDFPLGWLEAGYESEPTDEDCWRPDRVLEALDLIEGECRAHPEKFPTGFQEQHQPLIDGMRRVAEAARKRKALVLTTIG
jgi:hypothetical protein